MTATFHVGDAIEVMGKLPEKSVDLVLTSPPFLALRSYLPADHPDKALEGGSQATPGAFIDWLIDVVEACDRVLAPHGSLCIELGDTYASSPSGSGAALSFRMALNGERDKAGPAPRRRPVKASPDKQSHRNMGEGDVLIGGGTGWPLAKSLSLIPELFRLTLVYGFNPLTGRTTERWRLRNVVRWVRPNPPVGALGDKFRPATSELMVFCKSAKRYFDLDAVRTPLQYPDAVPTVGPALKASLTKGNTSQLGDPMYQNPAGAPPLDWWNIPPGGYEGAHYAVFPPELCIKPIKAMCPEKVCRQCGEPSRRIVEKSERYEEARATLSVRAGTGWDQASGNRADGLPSNAMRAKLSDGSEFTAAEYTTTGWTTCGHDDWRLGVVLDPFVGSGTTLLVATGHGRDAIGIDLDERNYQLALNRVGPFILERA